MHSQRRHPFSSLWRGDKQLDAGKRPSQQRFSSNWQRTRAKPWLHDRRTCGICCCTTGCTRERRMFAASLLLFFLLRGQSMHSNIFCVCYHMFCTCLHVFSEKRKNYEEKRFCEPQCKGTRDQNKSGHCNECGKLGKCA